MTHTMKTAGIVVVLLSLLLLTACSSSTPTATPTIDLDPFRTEVAATVLAQVTRDLASTPSTTPVPSPTATITLTQTPTLGSGASPSPNATVTIGTPQPTPIDQAEWVSQSIADGTIFAPGETFTMTWTLKNAGASTWTVGYLLRFYSGNTFGAAQEIPLGQTVLPNQTVEITIPMTAPIQPGDYRSDWVLSTESRSNFKEPFFLKITVALPPTPTPTSTSAASATATP